MCNLHKNCYNFMHVIPVILPVINDRSKHFSISQR